MACMGLRVALKTGTVYRILKQVDKVLNRPNHIRQASETLQ